MAQGDLVVANATGLAFRQDVNAQLLALGTLQSGPSAPSTTYAYMLWADTTAGQLKIRNAANDGWVVLQQLDGSLSMQDGSAATPGLAFASDTNTGIFRPGADQFGIATGGVENVEFGTSEVVFNDGGADIDFRIEGDTEPNLFKIDAGTDQVQVANLNGGPLAGTRNRIINGDMRIDQRATAVTTSGTYSVDRWQPGVVTSGAFQAAQSSTAPTGFDNSLLFDVTTADTSIAAGEFAALFQYIEGYNVADFAWGTASAKTVTLSFWVRSTTTGTYCIKLGNADSSRSYIAEYTVSAANTWEYKTITVPGDTSGTWNKTNGIGLSVIFTFATGTTFQTTANSWATGNFLGTSNQVNLLASTANEIRITGVQLEAGSVATPFERRSYGQELALCQRYFELFYMGSYSVVGQAYNTSSAVAILHFKVQKRATPTLVLPAAGNTSGTIAFTNSGTNYPATIGTHSVTAISVSKANIEGTGYTSAFTAGNVALLYASGSPTIQIGAEF